jgi:hypothetical protein
MPAKTPGKKKYGTAKVKKTGAARRKRMAQLVSPLRGKVEPFLIHQGRNENMKR